MLTSYVHLQLIVLTLMIVLLGLSNTLFAGNPNARAACGLGLFLGLVFELILFFTYAV